MQWVWSVSNEIQSALNIKRKKNEIRNKVRCIILNENLCFYRGEILINQKPVDQKTNAKIANNNYADNSD